MLEKQSFTAEMFYTFIIFVMYQTIQVKNVIPEADKVVDKKWARICAVQIQSSQINFHHCVSFSFELD